MITVEQAVRQPLVWARGKDYKVKARVLSTFNKFDPDLIGVVDEVRCVVQVDGMGLLLIKNLSECDLYGS